MGEKSNPRMLRERVKMGQKTDGADVAWPNGVAKAGSAKREAKASLQKQKADRLEGDLPFNAVRTAELRVLDCVFTATYSEAAEAASAFAAFLCDFFALWVFFAL